MTLGRVSRPDGAMPGRPPRGAGWSTIGRWQPPTPPPSTSWPSPPGRAATCAATTASSSRRSASTRAATSACRDEVMRGYVAQTVAAQRVPHVTIAWQGGEPTLMGLDFFRRARAVEDALRARPACRSSARSRRTACCSTTSGPPSSPRTTTSWASASTGRASCTTPTVTTAAAGRSSTACSPPPASSSGTAPSSTCSARSTRPTRGIRSRSTASSATSSRRATSSSSRSSRSRRRRRDAARDGHRPQRAARGRTAASSPRSSTSGCAATSATMFVQFFDGVLAAYLRGYSSLCVLRPDLRRGRRAGAQRRPLLLRPLRRPRAPARQHRGDADRRAGRARSSSVPSVGPSRRPCPPSAAPATTSSPATASAPRTASCSRPTASPASTGCARGSRRSSRTPSGRCVCMAEILAARRRGARDHAAPRRRGTLGRPQRPLPLRQRQEVQALLRPCGRLT